MWFEICKQDVSVWFQERFQMHKKEFIVWSCFLLELVEKWTKEERKRKKRENNDEENDKNENNQNNIEK